VEYVWGYRKKKVSRSMDFDRGGEGWISSRGFQVGVWTGDYEAGQLPRYCARHCTRMAARI
jgi:hypothetical protein